MSWPTLTDYCGALQHPATCFTDPDLRQAKVLKTDKFGNPRGPAGAYAVVYQLGNGAKTWAVKCFTSDVPDQHERYDAISRHLAQANLPYTVPFLYEREGIRLPGFQRKTFPILKMEWVSGKQIDEYIRDNLYDEGALDRLAQQWVHMMRALRGAQIGHGDLQHGNVKVAANGELRLLDYDGMTVPSLVGRNSVEIGHRNYQHPSRKGVSTQIGSDVDNFAAWVILLSIVAARLDATLWHRAGAGDDNLLFKQTDFETPERSEVLRLLEASHDQQLRALAATFRYFLYVDDLRKIPPVDDVQLPGSPTPSPGRRASWIDDHVVPATSAPVRATPPSPAEHGDASTGLLWAFRALTLLFLAAIAGAPQLLSGTPLAVVQVTLFAAPFAALVALSEFRGGGMERRRLVRERHKALAAAARSERQIKELLDAETRANADEKAKLAAINAKQQQLAQQEKVEKDRTTAELTRTLNDIRARRSDLPARQVRERAAEVDKMREAYVAQRLTAFRIEHASLQNVSSDLLYDLAAAGIRTAADVVGFRITGRSRTYGTGIGSFVTPSGRLIRVRGFGEVRGNRVVAWAREKAAHLARQAPTALNATKEAEIRQRFQREAQQLDASEAAAHSKAQQELQRIGGKYRTEQTRLATELHATRNDIAVWRADNQKNVHRFRQEIAAHRASQQQLDAQIATYERFAFARFARRAAFMDGN